MQPSIPDFCPACDPTLEKTAATRLVHDDGAEILFAATRELLTQLTSRSLHGEVCFTGCEFRGWGSRVAQQ